jgi:hypothetical protein
MRGGGERERRGEGEREGEGKERRGEKRIAATGSCSIYAPFWSG